MMDDRIYDSARKIDKSYLPLLKARDVKRYRVVWGNNYIKYGAHLAAPRDPEIFKGKRIIIQRIVSGPRLLATYLDSDFICNTDIITLKPKDERLAREPMLFVLGVMSSLPVVVYVKSRNVNLDRAAFPKINMETLATLPIPSLDCSKPADKSRHDKMVQLVEQMLSLHKQLPAAKTDQEKTVIQRQIEATDKQIDALVYELYGLTEEEIKIVEGR
jgi:restriction endonuclease S subunit